MLRSSPALITADNCGVATVTNNAPVRFPVANTVAFRPVTDVHGNTATCNQTVTVIDTQNPTITCPADAGLMYRQMQVSAMATGVALGTPTTADNCGVATVTNKRPAQFPVGSITVTSTVTDVRYTATCDQTVTVVDTQNPTITCPADVSERT
ncbi:MAG: HYR domain-containing protein [Bacteroidales bacterium]